jgi:hypothetical protein
VDVPSDISVRTVSGNVAVAVARGLEVDVDATSISGQLTSTMPLDGTRAARQGRRLHQCQDGLGRREGQFGVVAIMLIANPLIAYGVEGAARREPRQLFFAERVTGPETRCDVRRAW